MISYSLQVSHECLIINCDISVHLFFLYKIRTTLKLTYVQINFLSGSSFRYKYNKYWLENKRHILNKTIASFCSLQAGGGGGGWGGRGGGGAGGRHRMPEIAVFEVSVFKKVARNYN